MFRDTDIVGTRLRSGMLGGSSAVVVEETDVLGGAGSAATTVGTDTATHTTAKARAMPTFTVSTVPEPPRREATSDTEPSPTTVEPL